MKFVYYKIIIGNVKDDRGIKHFNNYYNFGGDVNQILKYKIF